MRFRLLSRDSSMASFSCAEVIPAEFWRIAIGSSNLVAISTLSLTPISLNALLSVVSFCPRSKPAAESK